MDSRDIVREYNKRFIEPQIGYRRLASKLTAGLYETLTGKDMLSMPIEEALMGRKGRHRIYKKAVRALNRVGVKTIGDLTELSKADLIGVKGSGPAIVKYIQEELGGYGFGLKEDGATYDIPTALIPAKEAFRKLPRKNYTLRAIKMLDEMGIETLHDLAKFTKEQLLSKGCTENLAEYMKDVLKNYGFYLEGEPIYDGKDALSVPVDEAGFGVWACNVLLSEGLETLGDVVKYSKKDLSKIRNAGEKTIKWIEEGLAKYGLSLRESGQGLEAPSKSIDTAFRPPRPHTYILARAVLKNMGIETIGEVAELTPDDIRSQRITEDGVLKCIKKVLAKHGLTLRDPDSE